MRRLGQSGCLGLMGAIAIAPVHAELPQTIHPEAWLQPSSVRVSQQPVSAAPRQKGRQLVLNGRALAVPWQQWQTSAGPRFGITDGGLIQQFGVQLLDTENAQNQPVQWFSEVNQTPLTLSTHWGQGDRYLDITDLATQFGWQVGVTGATLQIATPAAQLVDIRQGQEAWGDRLVIQLDQPVPWQVEELGQEIIVTIEAPVSPKLIQPLKTVTGRYIQSLQVEALPNQTRLRIGLTTAIRPRVWSVPAPNRIVVDLRPDSLVPQNNVWAPGVRWRQQLLTLGTRQIPAVWLELNPQQAGLRLAPIAANPTTMTGIASVWQIAQQAQVFGAINGGFFNRDRQLPLGALRQNGRWLSGPILNRGAIAWDEAGTFQFDRLSLQGAIATPTGQRFPLTHLNSGYVQAGIARYTPDWGPTYTSLSNAEMVVTVQNNQVIQQQSLEQAGATVPIPANAYLLVLRANRSAAAAFPLGTPLTLEEGTTPSDWRSRPNILGAGPLLIQNQQIVLDANAESFSPAFATQRAARSAIAQKQDGTILLLALHADLNGTGFTLQETAQLLQQLGAVHALNLDGGSSTTLYLGGQILDQAQRTTARVHNILGLFLTPPP